ncbi:hypothetical protein [Acetobacter syzygii]|uniref:hypothetical protein n=1 Tax=Acetobacter syzygii TaxID=146476 RepID=UPI0039E88452
MGSEESAIIMSPQFINATFQAGEDWYYGMLERTQEANRLAQHRHSFEVANARCAVINHQLLHDAREQNAKPLQTIWSRSMTNMLSWRGGE